MMVKNPGPTPGPALMWNSKSMQGEEPALGSALAHVGQSQLQDLERKKATSVGIVQHGPESTLWPLILGPSKLLADTQKLKQQTDPTPRSRIKT